ncbi:hypothetical protein ANN_00445 [Periplaneta americana]|uniref:Uncharacterized protein n=1 Tax=Periplaneta americana TaxID=6978 RepID=A0ABQ8TQV1_PERAM|nr:hypothetical protein ANN_00445 [Periplaneta americana]
MAGLCEGGNEPPGSLKASKSGKVLGRCLNTPALSCPRRKISQNAKSGDRAGQGTSPREEIKRPGNI